MLVFVVDDDDAFRVSLLRLLTSAGYEAQGFSSAPSLQRLEQVGQDAVIILDVKMPGMDGLELQRWLHQMRPRLQVIVVSGSATTEERRTAMRQGAAGFLAKPFDGDSLVALLSRVVNHEAVGSRNEARQEPSGA